MTINKKNRKILFMILAVSCFLMAGCGDDNRVDLVHKANQSAETKVPEEKSEEEDFTEAFMEREQPGMEEILEKGYNLPLSKSAKEEAETDCKKAMEKLRGIYREADKGNSLNPTPDRESILKMYEVLEGTLYPVTAAGFHYTTGNYEKMEAFLLDCLNGTKGKQTLYHITAGGGINRSQFLFDGKDMYVIDTISTWSTKEDPVIAGSSLNRIRDWKYTERGWFSYEYCMPEFPDVTELANGNNLLRIKPMEEEYIRIAESYLLPIGYLGSNLLRSNWDSGHMEGLDYNGLYEYLYRLKYQKEMDPDAYADGIPKEEFETLLTEYLPITSEALAEYAVYDGEKMTYGWKRLGPLTYMANRFSNSIPEVREIEENPDGTTSLTINAVCEAMGEDCVMSHVLKLQILEDGNVRYLGNQVLENGLEKITEYQYRLPQTDTDPK